MSAQSSLEKPRKLLRWTDSSELEDVTREHTPRCTDDTTEGPGPIALSKREDWYGVKMQRLRDNVEQLRKDLRNKERDYIRVKNKYNVSKRRQLQLQDDLQKYTEGKLDSDAELEFLRLQLLEKDNELSKQVENVGHFETEDDSGHFEKADIYPEEDHGIDDDAEESYFTDDSDWSRRYLNLHKETRKLLTYVVLSFAVFFSLISLVTRSSFLSTIVVGFWTVGLSCLWLERKQLFRSFKLKYLMKIRELSVGNSQLLKEKAKLESKVAELGLELANEKREHEDVISKLQSLNDKLGEEKSKNEELVKLEKSTFEDLQSERVRRRRAEEQLEEVSAQVLSARETDEVAKCGDMCEQLRNNALQLERESKEKLSRENERLIKEIVKLNMKQEKERLEHEEREQQVKTRNELPDGKEEKNKVVAKEQMNGVDINLRYTEERIEQADDLNQAREDMGWIVDATKDKSTKFGEEIKNFDSKECETVENFQCSNTEGPNNSSHSKTHDASSQTPNINQNTTQSLANSKECWLCSWNIPNDTSLALLALIVACLVLALKEILTSNVYMFVVLMALVGCFTYYQVARNIDQSN